MVFFLSLTLGLNEEKKMTQEEIILGIDPGTRITGYALLKQNDKKISVLDYGAIRPPTQAALSKRYLIIYDSITSLIESFSPTAVVIESQFVHKNAQSAMKIGMAKAMALLAAEKRGISLFEYTPKKAKQAVVGNGNASKEQIQKMMQLLLNLPSQPQPQDAADALALCYCHLNSLATRRI